jgi:anti-sigma regulatory factor (Ser/Thr protein kinase)
LPTLEADAAPREVVEVYIDFQRRMGFPEAPNFIKTQAAVQLLKMRGDGQPSKELDIIERQARHLVRLVDDLLDVARLTRGKALLERAPVELATVVLRAVEMVSHLLEQRRHSLQVDVALGLILDGDENRLAQVLSNLLSNAAHYTPEGGRLGIVARRDGETLLIEVSDNGIGIASEELSEIFELFAQGANRSDAQGGLGLGLVVVKQLTELHGGSVSVASAGVGLGTKFMVQLPILPAGSVVPTRAGAQHLVPRALRPQRVLLDQRHHPHRLLCTRRADLTRRAAQSTTCPFNNACKRGTKFSFTAVGPLTEPEIIRP